VEALFVAFDVFISYASKDKIVADAVCARLEASGVRCWIAPRDIVAGTSYGEAIIEAIHGAKVMVLVFSSSANASGHIPKEVERAVSNGLAILPFRIEDVAPGKSLDYFIGSVHWLDAMTPPMEHHLDNLAATVHKLLPVKPGEPGVVTRTDATVMWQRNAQAGPQEPSHAAAIPVAAAPAARPATAQSSSTGPTAAGTAASGAAARASILNSKALWIGGAVVLFLVVVMGAMLMRGSRNSGGGGEVPAARNPAGGGNGGASDPDAGSNAPAATPNPTSPHHSPGAQAGGASGVDAIVGCYQWFNNVPVTIRADGTMTAGPFTAHWRLVNAEQRKYTFTWPVMIESLTVSPDQRSMSGGNQYGYPISGTRTSVGFGLAGTWRWSNGWNVSVAPNGTFTSGSFRGTWRAVDASRGIYEMNWPDPVDTVLLLGGGTRVSGSNQYGLAISGTKTGGCGRN
jgi:TIR domain